MNTAKPASNKSLRIRVGLAALLAVAVLSLPLWQRTPPPALQVATLVRSPKTLQPFELIDHNGTPFDGARLQHQWSLVYFGYTHCPDVCPTGLSDLNATVKLIARESPGVQAPQIIFVSVDPGRDSPEILKSYVPYFNPAFLGVTGSRDALAGFAKQLNASFVFIKETLDDKDYIVDHTVEVTLIDPEGKLYATFKPPLKPAAMAADYAALTHYYEDSQ